MAVARLTHARGATDTVAARDMWGLKEGGSRALVWTLALATVLHLPLLPTHLAGWIRLLFHQPVLQIVPRDHEVIVPIELDMGLFEDEPSEPDGVALQPPDAPAVADGDDDDDDEDLEFDEDDDEDEDEDEPDAGAPDAGAGGAPPEPDAGVATPDAGIDDPYAEPDAGVADAGAVVLEPDAGIADAGAALPAPDGGAPPDAGAPPVARRPIDDPNKAAGDASKVAAKNPNVRIYLATDVMREQALGMKFGRLLAGIKQWRELIGGTGINPVRDFDHILISGPQMRDIRDLVAVMDFNLTVPRMRKAVDKVIARSKPAGRWIDRKGPPEVAAIGARSERRVALLPKQRILVVLPTSGEKQIPALKSLKPFRKSGRAMIIVFVVTPWRAFIGAPVQFPKSIAWLRLRLLPKGGGAYQLEVDAKDGSAADAKRNAAEVEKLVESIRPVPVISLFVKKYFFGKPSFEVHGSTIRATAEVSGAQIDRILDLLGQRLNIELSKP
jgi:hypothetical protein